jgi:hypothetical protein
MSEMVSGNPEGPSPLSSMKKGLQQKFCVLRFAGETRMDLCSRGGQRFDSGGIHLILTRKFQLAHHCWVSKQTIDSPFNLPVVGFCSFNDPLEISNDRVTIHSIWSDSSEGGIVFAICKVTKYVLIPDFLHVIYF